VRVVNLNEGDSVAALAVLYFDDLTRGVDVGGDARTPNSPQSASPAEADAESDIEAEADTDLETDTETDQETDLDTEPELDDPTDAIPVGA
jgi:hypothetical protein